MTKHLCPVCHKEYDCGTEPCHNPHSEECSEQCIETGRLVIPPEIAEKCQTCQYNGFYPNPLLVCMAHKGIMPCVWLVLEDKTTICSSYEYYQPLEGKE